MGHYDEMEQLDYYYRNKEYLDNKRSEEKRRLRRLALQEREIEILEKEIVKLLSIVEEAGLRDKYTPISPEELEQEMEAIYNKIF